MNKLRIIRFAIICLLFLSILIGIKSFYHQDKIVIKDKTPNRFEAKMIIENGEHYLYSQGEKFAFLRYKKAVQSEKLLKIEDVRVDFLKKKGDLNSGFAFYKKGSVIFKDKINGELKLNKIKFIITPPATLKKAILSGKNSIKLKSPQFFLSGKSFFFNVEKGALIIKNTAHLKFDNFNIQSNFNVSQFSKPETLYFFKNSVVRNTKERVLIYSDFVSVVPERNSFRLSGRCVLTQKKLNLRFTEGFFKVNDKNYMLIMDNQFAFCSGEVSGTGIKGKLNRASFYADYLKVFFNNLVISAIQNKFFPQKQEGSGVAPYIFSLENSRVLKGESYKLGKNLLYVFQPVFRENGDFLVSEVCQVNEKGEIVFPQAVSGVFKSYEFKGASAIIKADKRVMKHAKLISLLDKREGMSGKLVIFDSKGFITLEDSVNINKLAGKNSLLKVKCNLARFDIHEKLLLLKDRVSIIKGDLKAKPEKAVVYKKYGILFNCRFKIQRKYSGFARIIVVNFDKRHSYLFNAEVKDKNGNTLKGGKLTLDNLTDRIFIEKTKKTGRVEVKIKI